MNEMNWPVPDIPRDIFDIAGDDPDLTFALRCSELWDEVIVEILHRDYANRSHHNVGTYNEGCRGPLCRKALREHPKRKTPQRAALQMRDERIFDPVLEYFHTVAKHRVRLAQQEILQGLKEGTNG